MKPWQLDMALLLREVYPSPVHGRSQLAEAIGVDPFCGSGTTGIVARRLGLRGLGFELDPAACDIASARIAKAHVTEKRPPKQPEPEIQGALL